MYQHWKAIEILLIVFVNQIKNESESLCSLFSRINTYNNNELGKFAHMSRQLDTHNIFAPFIPYSCHGSRLGGHRTQKTVLYVRCCEMYVRRALGWSKLLYYIFFLLFKTKTNKICSVSDANARQCVSSSELIGAISNTNQCNFPSMKFIFFYY